MDPVASSFAFQLDGDAMDAERAVLQPLPSAAARRVPSLTHKLDRLTRRVCELISGKHLPNYPAADWPIVWRLMPMPLATGLTLRDQITFRRRARSQRTTSVCLAYLLRSYRWGHGSFR